MESMDLSGVTVVLDLDGTLVDSAPDLVATLNVLLADEGIAALPLASARNMIGRGARALIERGFAASGTGLSAERLDGLFERFILHYRAHIADHSALFPGAVEALARLRSAGARLAVCTNKRTDLSVALLEALDAASLFEAVVGGDAVSACKPAADHIVATVAAAGGRLDRAIMVGDSDSDAGAARAAGVPLILVSFGYTDTRASDLGPDILVDGFDELPSACSRIAGLFPRG